jgi:hypothetical protein
MQLLPYSCDTLNKPLEWTDLRQVCFDSYILMPVTLWQR